MNINKCRIVYFFFNKLSGVLGWRDYAGSIRRIVDDTPTVHREQRQPTSDPGHRCQWVDVGSIDNED